MNNYELALLLVSKIGGHIERRGRMIVHIAVSGLRSHVRFTTGSILFRQPKTANVTGVFYMDSKRILSYYAY